MQRAAEAAPVRASGGYKRQIEQLEEIREGQRVSSLGGEDRDVVSLARIGDDAIGLILEVRDGQLLGKEHHLLGNVEVAEVGQICLSS